LGIDGYERVQDLAIHYCGWERTPSDPIPGMKNILLGHISVFEKAIPFYWKSNGYTAETIKKEYPNFDLYLLGDIHVPFVRNNVVVSGPMMRMGIDLMDYKPRCYLIDTDTWEIKPLYYKIKKEVFNVVDSAVAANLNLDSLVQAMKKSANLKASYKRDCLSLADAKTKLLLEEIFNELDN
jgi:DNA repair exonuclease SbcCD nuclease subunit